MIVHIFNEVCSEGWSCGNEAIPEVFTDLDKAIERGYERYMDVWDENWQNLDGEESHLTKEEFYEEAKNGKGRCIVIQLYDCHYQFEFYDVEIDKEVKE